MVIEDLVRIVLSELRTISKTETVIGDPIKVENATIVPISRVSVGFGVGGGKTSSKNREGEATGGGLSIEPMAFIIVRKEKVELITLEKETTGLGKVIDLIPDIVEKIKKIRGNKDKRSKGVDK